PCCRPVSGWAAGILTAAREPPYRHPSRPACPPPPSDFLEHVRNPADAFDDRLAGGGVRETEVAFSRVAERAPGGHRDVRLLEDPFRERRALHSDVDAGKDVERATRTIRRESVDLLELPEDEIPSGPEFVDHRLQRSGRSSDSRDARLLRERGRAGD